MLDSYADLLEAQEKAVPAAEVVREIEGPGIVHEFGALNESLPVGTKLYTHHPPADAERLVEAPTDAGLIAFAAEEEFLLFCSEDEFMDIARSVLRRFGNSAHSAQAQPPAARVTDASGALRFAWKVLDASRESLADVGGDSIQDWAVECGLLEPVIMPSDTPDSERCYWCEGGECECFRYTKLARTCEAMLAAQENPNG